MKDRHEAAVRALLKLFDTKTLDLDALHAAFAPGVRFQSIVPLGTELVGPDAVCAELAQQYQLYDECDCQVLAVAGNGRQVFAERRDTVRMLADGRRVTVHVTGVFELDDQARVTGWREYWDGLSMAQQTGLPYEEMARIVRGLAEA